MRQTIISKTLLVSFCAIALSACGSSEVKTGSLVQRYAMTDSQGVNFGTVQLDPINGGTILDAQGRAFARVIPFVEQTAQLQ